MIWRDTDVRMIWKTLLLIFYLNVFPPNKWGMYWYYLVITRDKKKYTLGLKQTQKAFFFIFPKWNTLYYYFCLFFWQWSVSSQMFPTGNSLRYQHWAYQRNTRTSLATGSTPITSSSVSKLSECWDLCGATPACSAFSYDENASICFIFENTDDVVNVTKNQKYFVVQTRVQYSDALSKTFWLSCVIILKFIQLIRLFSIAWFKY